MALLAFVVICVYALSGGPLGAVAALFNALAKAFEEITKKIP